MLNLAYTLPILTFFGLLVSAKDRHEVRGVVAGCVWVEYPYVKKCILCITPEASCSDVQTGIVFYVGCAVVTPAYKLPVFYLHDVIAFTADSAIFRERRPLQFAAVCRAHQGCRQDSSPMAS